MTPEDDYFSALSAPRAFSQSPSALQTRFYELSRALHPDRFTGAELGDRALSMERMSLVNQAYTTLKDPNLRGEYLLQLEGIEPPKGKGQLPMELAESWFELQDLLSDDPAAASSRLEAFEQELDGFVRAEQEAIVALERAYDSTGSRAALDEIARRIQAKSYLKSLERDINRIKNR